jgi:glycosyltransferase involved in cell wall biosynthesis
MELDPNSAWMDRILWDTPEFRELLDSCTVIGVSSKKMQRHLSRKWPYIIDYLPNGWYNYTGQDTTVDFSQKENIILTVGRIGTYPKQNHILLNAFASIKDQLPDWTLKLVGPINEAFIPFVEDFFQHNPDLNRRVVFTGAITDKEKLMCEYAQAKIFAMTSSSEGGTPNVIAEALFSGCYIVTSDIDGAIDCTNNGACGSVFPIDNVEALSQQLLTACQSPVIIKQGGQHALRYASMNFDFEHIVERLHYLLHGGSAS